MTAELSERSNTASDAERSLAVSSGQRQMWLLNQLAPASPAYLMAWTLRISGPLDVEGLRRAWERIVERYEILRTRYRQSGDELCQIIDPPGRFALRLIDLADEPSGRREERARQIADWEGCRPFDLTTQRPVRVSVIAVEPDLHLMVVTIHHIACDDVSYDIIRTELAALYAEQVSGAPSGLPEVAVQYADFTARQQTRTTDAALRPHLDYWRGALSGVRDLPVPLDRPRPSRPDRRGGLVELAIGSETAAGVFALAAAQRASPFMVMLAAYHVMLSQLTGSDDLTVGVPVSTRTPDLDGLVGYMVNTVVVRSRHPAGQTFAEVVAHVRGRFLDAFDHRSAPFERVVDELNPSRDAGANPLFQAAFDMERIDEDGFRLPGLVVERLGAVAGTDAKFDLNLHVAQSSGGRLFAQLEYAAAVIDPGTAQKWAAEWEALLEVLVGQPDEPIAIGPAPMGGPGADRAAAVPPASAAGGSRASAPDSLIDAIHQVWAEVLERGDVGIQDNFFDVGGDSLRAVALAGRLRADGLPVSAADVFAYQTIEELAEWCLAGMGTPDSEDGTALFAAVAPFELLSPDDRAALPPDVVDAYPLAATQLGMIIELMARPDVNAYQDTTSYLIRDGGEPDMAALQRAAQLVVDRHEVLRTSFDLSHYSVPLQLVHRTADIVVGVTDHGALGPDGWRPGLEKYAAGERRSPMELATAPLIRVHAHTACDADEWWITITECHPILEGWSFHTMLMEILDGYRDIRAGRRPAEPEPGLLRYADYVAAEAAARTSEEDREFWRGTVQGRVEAALPVAWQGDRALPRERYQHALYFRDLEDDLQRLATQTRTSMKAVLLAAHMKVMSMVTATEDFYTGLVCDARPEVAGAERVLGMYLNTLPFPMPAGARTWGELVRAVYDGLTGLWPHRVFPMQVIQQEFGPGGRLLDVFFNYLDFHQVDADLIDEDQIYNDNDNEFGLHVFTISGILKLNTTSHRLSREAAARLTALYRTVLEKMSLGPDGDASAACLPARERTALRGLDGGAEPADEPLSVPQSFASAVREHPDDVAVRCGDESVSYARLDAWADALARELRGCGVGADALVAVVSRREPSTVAAFLAAWKVGAAWIPLAPETVADDAHRHGVSVVVTATAADLVGVDLGGLPVVAARGPAAAEPARRAPVAHLADPACVIPGESGTEFSHRALGRALQRLHHELDGRGVASVRGSSWLCASPLTTAAGLLELLAPLASGAAVVITHDSVPDAIPEMRALISAAEVTHLQTTALVADRLLDSSTRGVTAIIGGDADATPAAASRLRDRARMVVSTVGAEGLFGPVAFDGVVPRGLSLRVVDARQRQVPTAVVGELCVVDAELHRTGLLARVSWDGTLETMGAHRTPPSSRPGSPPAELHRTRALLDLHPAVLESRVLTLSDPERLVGYVRMAPGAEFSSEEIRRFLADRRLPRHLNPDSLTTVDEWPLTASGTVDPDRLPDPSDGTAEPSGTQPAERPWDDRFAGILRDVLGAASPEGGLEPDVPLSDAGLGSMATVGLMVAIEQIYDIVIPDDFQIVDMFRTPRMLWEAVCEFLTADEEQRV